MNAADRLAAIRATRELTSCLRTAERGWDWGRHGERIVGDRQQASLRSAQLIEQLFRAMGRRTFDPVKCRPFELADGVRAVRDYCPADARTAN